MPLEIQCYRCKKTLNEPGGLLFGPPVGSWPSKRPEEGYSVKTHLCHDCYTGIILLINEDRKTHET